MKTFKLSGRTQPQTQPPSPILQGFIVVDMNGKAHLETGPYEALVDTGASLTVIPESAAHVAGSATGAKVPCTGFNRTGGTYKEYWIQLRHGDLGTIPVRAVAVPESQRILLGRDFFAGNFMRPMTLVIDWRSGDWSLGTGNSASGLLTARLASALGEATQLSS